MSIEPRATIGHVAVWCCHDEILPITKIKPRDNNPNKHPARQIELLANIIEKQGWRAVITISKRSGLMTKGHGRLSAAMNLGLTSAPVEYQDYESEASEWADVVADNRIASYAELDTDLVEEVLAGIDLGDFDLSLTGYEITDLDLDTPPAPPKTKDSTPRTEHAPELVEKWGVERGQMWRLGRHRLLCGDATDKSTVARLMDFARPDMVFADPPYGVGYSSRVDPERRKPWGGITNDDLDDEALGKLIAAAVPDIVPRFVCCDWHCYAVFEKALGKPKAVCVWDKGHFGLGKGYRRQHEFILFYGTLNRTDLSDLWQFSRAADYKHPTQKPTELVEKAIRDVEGRVVYDPFCGSGTSIIACENLTRTCLAVEIEPKYVAVTIERYVDVTGTEPEVV